MNDLYFNPVADHELEKNSYIIELQISMASTLDYPFNEMIKKVMKQISKEYIEEYTKNSRHCRQAGMMLLCRSAYPEPVEDSNENIEMAEKIFSSLVDLEWLRRMEILDYFISNEEALRRPDIQIKVDSKALIAKLESMIDLNRPNARLLKFLKRQEETTEVDELIPERN